MGIFGSIIKGTAKGAWFVTKGVAKGTAKATTSLVQHRRQKKLIKTAVGEISKGIKGTQKQEFCDGCGRAIDGTKIKFKGKCVKCKKTVCNKCGTTYKGRVTCTNCLKKMGMTKLKRFQEIKGETLSLIDRKATKKKK